MIKNVIHFGSPAEKKMWFDGAVSYESLNYLVPRTSYSALTSVIHIFISAFNTKMVLAVRNLAGCMIRIRVVGFSLSSFLSCTDYFSSGNNSKRTCCLIIIHNL